jgi:hypothetical protein
LLRVALAAIEPLLGPEVSCGQCYQAELYRNTRITKGFEFTDLQEAAVLIGETG